MLAVVAENDGRGRGLPGTERYGRYLLVQLSMHSLRRPWKTFLAALSLKLNTTNVPEFHAKVV